MSPGDVSRQQPESGRGRPPLDCEACESALHSPTERAVSFLVLDQLTAPLLGCDDHLEQFVSVCGYTSDDLAELLEHRPAGGISCPSCQLTLDDPEQPLIPVQNGAVAPLVCPEHQAEIMTRFRAGLDTRRQLTASLDELA